MKKRKRLKHRLKKLSAGQKRLKIENLAKNGMYRPLAYVCVEILVIPFLVSTHRTVCWRDYCEQRKHFSIVFNFWNVLDNFSMLYFFRY
jgi:hypothetical protein